MLGFIALALLGLGSCFIGGAATLDWTRTGLADLRIPVGLTGVVSVGLGALAVMAILRKRK